MTRKPNPPREPAALVFFDYERAVLSGDRRRADRLAKRLRAAGYFVRRLPTPNAPETGGRV